MMSRFWQVWAILVAAGFIVMPCSSRAQDGTQESQQRPPKPIEPPHKPAQQGFRLAATIGFNLIGSGKYAYKTAVTLPNGNALDYGGTQRSSGGTLSLGLEATPPGALRRFSIGFDLNFGGVDVGGHPVIPSGPATPQSSLNAQIGQASITGPPWRPFISPYIEHELGSIWQNRIRLGYQYWRATGSYHGSFSIDQPPSNRANYEVRFSQSSNMVRLSVHNDTWLDDPETDQTPPKRRSGMVQKGGVLLGTDGSVVVFVNIGLVWTL
jgi:hypothetical protein